MVGIPSGDSSGHMHCVGEGWRGQQRIGEARWHWRGEECAYKYMFVYMCVCVCVYVPVYVHVYAYTYLYVHVYVHVDMIWM